MYIFYLSIHFKNFIFDKVKNSQPQIEINAIVLLVFFWNSKIVIDTSLREKNLYYFILNII